MTTDMNPKRRSKIARLPKALREELNFMLDQGATYQTIIDWLTSQGHAGFNVNNLFHWKEGGYQDWRLEQQRKEQAKALRDWCSTMAVEHDPTVVASALSTFSAARFHKLLCTLDLSTLGRALQDRPEVCIRYFNSILRSGRISLESARVRHPCCEKREERAPMSEAIGQINKNSSASEGNQA
jgi:hypothetical protein